MKKNGNVKWWHLVSVGVTVGFSNATFNGSLGNLHNSTANAWYLPADTAIYIRYGPANIYTVILNSLDADGFTIGWTKTGTPTGTLTVRYLAIR